MPWIRTGLLLLGLGALWAHAASYLPYLADDALISLQYAKRLLLGKGLTWTDGPPVEGYSNLLWVLGAAGLGALGLDLILAVRVLGFVGMSAAALALAAGTRAGPIARHAALGTFALAAPVAVWTVGGLEQPLLAALLAWGLVRSRPLVEDGASGFRAALAPGISFGLACLTRPDAPLFVGTAALVLLLQRGLGRRTRAAVAGLCAPALLLVGAQLAFRLAYYGEWVPNTALVKLQPPEAFGSRGALYLWRGLASQAPIWLLALPGCAGLLRDRARRRWCLFLLAPLAAWSGYVVWISGDFFPAWRHFVPLLVLLALLLGESVSRWEERATGTRARAALALVCLACLLAAFLQQRRVLDRSFGGDPRFVWRGEVIGRLLSRGFGERAPLIAVDPAGCVPYWSGLPSIDMLGLSDKVIARAQARAGSRPGHGHGDGAYVLARAPDLILFNSPSGGARALYKGGQEMQADPRFLATYSLTRFEGTEPFRVRSEIWVRCSGGRIGAVLGEREVRVPGYLVNGNPATVVRLDAGDRLAAAVEPGAPAWVADLPVGAGRWRLAADAAGELEAEVRAGGRTLASGAVPLAFEHAGDRPLELRLLARAPAALRELALDREAP